MVHKILPLIFLLVASVFLSYSQSIPLPEHPRPDFEREDWINLNGEWNFQFDSQNQGIADGWEKDPSFNKNIIVPFPWGSELSGLEDEADIGWYHRTITIPNNWKQKRTFVTVGASDWETTIWLDGELVGTHQGGYVPFSFELTHFIDYGHPQDLVIRVDDVRRDFTLYGKQGYGNARGIWQTIYLESRGDHYIDAVHFTPDIDKKQVNMKVYLDRATSNNLTLQVDISGETDIQIKNISIPAGKSKFDLDIPIHEPRLWSLEDPFLYEAEITLEEDHVKSYFGMRKISVVDLPGTDFPYIALNDKPVYMQLALDQSYHPEGFYTFPSDQFLIEEIMRSKSIGLNGIRTHIKVEVPRKLYWADKLGLLVMEDLPNSWGEPDAQAQAESEYTLRQMIKRDYNHPSIFSWVVFNETWGLWTKTEIDGKENRRYLPSTQYWVASMYYLAKSLDPSRLVEDNSICCGRGHTETDINSWHQYLPGWAWETHLKNIDENTYPGSTHHFEDGFTQGRQPNINSECGNVWGYEGSTGDVDWSWDYHRMLNTFRMFPKIGGWLYTEHHDVINEWNGYWRFDRTEKETGMGAIFDGMSLVDLHAPVYLSTGNEICKSVNGGQIVEVPLYLSVMTDALLGETLEISYQLKNTNYIGGIEKGVKGSFSVPYQPWMQKELESLSLRMPDIPGVAILGLTVSNEEGQILQKNFMHFVIESGRDLPEIETISVPAKSFVKSDWSKKQWNILDGKKVNGAGTGSFVYELDLSKGKKYRKAKEAEFLVELSAKELFVKDQEEYNRNQDFMKGSRVAPSSNPNAYPMTDETFFPSEISIRINGIKVLNTTLKDDPADHRGVLSWHAQLKDRKLREAGSYGYLVKVPITKRMLKNSIKEGKMTVELSTEGEGGIAVYGKDFGRYPLDPTLVLKF